MGRIATSIIAISVALCTVPLGQLRLYGMQDADSTVQAIASENASGEASATEDATAEASQPPEEAGKPAPAGSETPVNPASPPPPPALSSNGSGSSATSNGNAAVTTPVAGGSGDGSNPKGNGASPAIGPGNISVEVGTPPGGALQKETSFNELIFSNPLNLILFAFIALYVLLLFLPKPGAKERKAQQQLLSSLKKNDRVVLNSGIHGVVSNINTEAGTVTIRVDESSNAKITVDRTAIRNVVA